MGGMSKKPKILITNDDGISAPGIRHLWRALAAHADLTIVAPMTEQSGMSLAVTLRTPLRITPVAWPEGTPAWSVNGTPVDCVKMALTVLKATPDLIVSGINRGTNSGRTVLYSGTVGGVIEGILRGVPGVAFSSYDFDEPEFAAFEPFIPTIVNLMMRRPLPTGSMLNVSFPGKEKTAQPDGRHVIGGIKLTRQGRQYWIEDPEAVHYDASAQVYTFGAKLQEFVEHEESDIFWLSQGYVTCVPVHVDELTDWRYLESQKAHFEAGHTADA